MIKRLQQRQIVDQIFEKVDRTSTKCIKALYLALRRSIGAESPHAKGHVDQD
jgi:hypothetical protein